MHAWRRRAAPTPPHPVAVQFPSPSTRSPQLPLYWSVGLVLLLEGPALFLMYSSLRAAAEAVAAAAALANAAAAPAATAGAWVAPTPLLPRPAVLPPQQQIWLSEHLLLRVACYQALALLAVTTVESYRCVWRPHGRMQRLHAALQCSTQTSHLPNTCQCEGTCRGWQAA